VSFLRARASAAFAPLPISFGSVGSYLGFEAV
jgi:hypothetical protein